MIKLLCSLLLVLLSFSASASPQEIKLVFEVKENPPYYLDEGTDINWDKPGITLELLRLVQQQLGLNFTFERVPWARALKMTEHNQAQGVFRSSFKQSRTKIGVYPMINGSHDPSMKIMDQSYYLYKKKGHPLSWNGKQLSERNPNIGAVIGYAIIDDLKKLGAKVTELTSQQSGLEMLLLGRIDGWADIQTMSDTRINESPELRKYIRKIEPALANRPYYLMFSHQFFEENSELANKIWSTIKDIRSSDQYTNIASRYIQP